MKLYSNKGETLIETLVSLLISVFAILVLYGFINSAANLVSEADQRLSGYYEANNALIEKSSGGASGTISFSSSFIPSLTSLSVEYYTNDFYTAKPVISFKRSEE